jgi:hypothetical protein
MGNEKMTYPEEFKIQTTTLRRLNKNIYKFRLENPDYEIFNISISGTGGQYGGSMHYSVIWRLKNR